MIILKFWFVLQPFVIAVEEIETPIINDGVSKANVAWAKSFSVTNETEWDLLEQGELARGSVVPQERAVGEVVLVGSGIFENPDNPDGIYGCTKEDYRDANYTGKVALLYRGICKFEEKVILAAEAGASVVVIVNNNPEGAITMSIGRAEEYKVISLMITNNSGYRILQEIKEQEGEEKMFMQISKATSNFGSEKIFLIIFCIFFMK